MPRIVNNHICYSTHDVVLEMLLHKAMPNYVLEMADWLSDEGDAQEHLDELERGNNDGSWTISQPSRPQPKG